MIKTNKKIEKLINGVRRMYDIHEFHIDELFFNKYNGRIRSAVYDIDPNIENISNNELFVLLSKENKNENIRTKTSLKTNGLLNPIIINNDNLILDGNRRYTCLKEIFNEENHIPKAIKLKCIIVDNNEKWTKEKIETFETSIQFFDDSKTKYSSFNKALKIFNVVENIKDIETTTIEKKFEQASHNLNLKKSEIRTSYYIIKFIIKNPFVIDNKLNLNLFNKSFTIIRTFNIFINSTINSSKNIDGKYWWNKDSYEKNKYKEMLSKIIILNSILETGADTFWKYLLSSNNDNNIFDSKNKLNYWYDKTMNIFKNNMTDINNIKSTKNKHLFLELKIKNKKIINNVINYGHNKESVLKKEIKKIENTNNPVLKLNNMIKNKETENKETILFNITKKTIQSWIQKDNPSKTKKEQMIKIIYELESV